MCWRGGDESGEGGDPAGDGAVVAEEAAHERAALADLRQGHRLRRGPLPGGGLRQGQCGTGLVVRGGRGSSRGGRDGGLRGRGHGRCEREQRDLVRKLGGEYAKLQRRGGALLPTPRSAVMFGGAARSNRWTVAPSSACTHVGPKPLPSGREYSALTLTRSHWTRRRARST